MNAPLRTNPFMLLFINEEMHTSEVFHDAHDESELYITFCMQNIL